MDFTYRHATIKAGFVYPEGYAPYECYEGIIAGWQGCNGLATFSSPKNASAYYKSNSQITPSGNQWVKDTKYKYLWPKSDEEYKQFVN